MFQALELALDRLYALSVDLILERAVIDGCNLVLELELEVMSNRILIWSDSIF